MIFMKPNVLIKFLDDFLEKDKFISIDASLNGVQVGGYDKDIKHIAFAVDACQSTIDKASEMNADMLIVHHGLFWGKPLAINGSHKKRVETLLNNEIVLYASHLPLDSSMKCGHNYTMAQRLKMENVESAFYYHGLPVGVCGDLRESLSVQEISDILEFSNPIILDFCDKPIKRIGIVSGEGAHDISEAKALNCDLLITGEPRHSEYHYCEEEKISMLCAGHYESEEFGLYSLSSQLVKMFDIAISYISEPTGL
jgi:dinuclear metal center YbgI/SA1388 family protein